MKNLRVFFLLTAALLASAGAASADTEVVITGNDQMKFDKTAFKVKAGETVKLTLKNIGKMPKAAMGHNVVILKQDADWKKYAEVAVKHAKEEYLPPSKADEVIAATRMLGPGEEQTITFKAPEEKGEYDYICSFPAHAIVGMRGVMTVE